MLSGCVVRMSRMVTFQPRWLGFSLEGVIASVYLLDQTCFRIRISPTTTAGAVVSAVSDVMGLEHDAHHGLFILHARGEFIEIADGRLLATVFGNGTSWAEACALGCVFLYC